MKRRGIFMAWLKRLVLILACLFVLVPVLFVVNASFGKSTSLYSSTFIPKAISLKHYANLFTRTDFWLWMKNSAIVSFGGSICAVAFTVSMGYAFSRFHFKGRRYGLLMLILVQMVPSSVMIVAIYRMLVFMKLTNNPLGLILIYAGTSIPFNAWLMRGYFDSISCELEESAYIDGASTWQAFTKIALPLASPMIAVVFIFNLIAFYNDYILASIVMLGKQNYTVALGLRFFQAPYAANWAMFAAASVIACLPITIVFYSLQRFLVEGLTKGALKG
jgi:arabinogalactan oligomer/maltooligosaccharide transport system permease protein